jgi:hypothetical protein
MGCRLQHNQTRAVEHSFGACVSGADDCPYGGGNFTALTGSITIPTEYDSNVVCEYIITTGKTIYLSFDSFSTEECCDFVVVYDGTSVEGRLLGKFGGRTGKFDGPTIPDVLTAKSGSVFVQFTSDESGSAAGVGMRWSDIAPGTPAPTSLPTATGGTPSPDEDAFKLWRARIIAGVLVCAGFALGVLYSMDCPANYFRIVAEDVCRSAAAAVSQAYQGRETYVLSPQGCNLHDGGVFLNNATGQRVSTATLLCSGARLHLYSRCGP